MRITKKTQIPHSLGPSNHPYRSGAWTPLFEEVDAEDLDVIEGQVPTDLDGVYLRNTQNQVHEPKGRLHPFDGDGMIHQISFARGKTSYRNRFVRTRGFQAEQEAGRALWSGMMESPKLAERPGACTRPGLKDSSSTDVVVHAGRVLSSYYQCGEGYRLHPQTLENEGIEAWTPIDGISAHTKLDLATGELLFFNYSLHAPFMHYGVVDAHNKLVHYMPIPLPGPRLPHDMAFTENYAILNDLPVYWDPALTERGIYAVRFFDQQKSRFAIVPRRGTPDQIKWFEADPTYVLHWLNAYEEGDEIILDGYFEDDPTPPPNADAPAGYAHMMGFLDLHAFKSHLHRWRFNMRTGQTTEQRLDPRILEFGMFNQTYAGKPYRYAYSVTGKPGMFLFTGFVKHDLVTGQSWSVNLPDGAYASEAPFAPRVNAKDEDDGYLVSFITNETTGESECLLIDCKNFEAGPVCRIRLPHQLCSGTHSTWADRREFEPLATAAE
jgi:carotenoid cleavage dioxygenase